MAAAQPGAAYPEVPLSGTRAPAYWGMVSLIATEGTLFLIMIFAYFYLRWNAPRWPPAGIPLPNFSTDYDYLIPATVLLLGSSIPFQWAENRIKKGSRGGLIVGVGVSIFMALTFIALELWEWTHLGYGPQRDEYTSLFFTITGIHLAHVTVAVCMALYILARALRGDFSEHEHLAVENVTLYWHFVDAVWVFVFSTFYISPFIR